MPSHNFHFSDLTPEQQNEVVAKNPNISPMLHKLRKEGITKSLNDELINLLEIGHIDSGNIKLPKDAPEGVVVDHWDDVGQFIESIGDDHAKYAASVLITHNEDYTVDSYDPEQEAATALDRLTPRKCSVGR
jgi:hypothetical protein